MARLKKVKKLEERIAPSVVGMGNYRFGDHWEPTVTTEVPGAHLDPNISPIPIGLPRIPVAAPNVPAVNDAGGGT